MFQKRAVLKYSNPFLECHLYPLDCNSPEIVTIFGSHLQILFGDHLLQKHIEFSLRFKHIPTMNISATHRGMLSHIYSLAECLFSNLICCSIINIHSFKANCLFYFFFVVSLLIFCVCSVCKSRRNAKVIPDY